MDDKRKLDKDQLDEQDLAAVGNLEQDWEQERRRLFRGFVWSSAAAVAIIVLVASYLMMGADDEAEYLAQQPTFPPAAVTSPDGSQVPADQASPPAAQPETPAPPALEPQNNSETSR